MTNELKKPSVNAENNSIAVGSISAGGDVSGTITIGNTGYTVEEVSVLITQITSTFQPKPFDGRCPYKGLDVFEEEDAELFFGREKLVADLVSRVKDSRTLFVTGPSGSGKSSLVRAGLIHALKQGAIKGSERWLYATMKPGRDPLESLATAFSRLKSPELGNYFRQNVDQVKVLHECAESALTDNKNQRLVLFIDQFEEVFTQINNETERVAFLNLLTHAATIENGRVIILFSMRSDFVSNCATYPQLNALLNQQFVQIGAMQPEELVSAIAQPALRVGLRIDPDLIAQIINEMKGEPGALPLMQFALKDLFDSQQEKSGVIALTLNDYLQRGGIHKALERHADDSFSKLSRNEQELARSIFSGLIEIGRGTQDTKRTALFDELIPANVKAADVEAIVQKLADARLVTTDEQTGKDTVTISHEKLIDAWPWLKKLVNENRDAIALQNEIASAAKEWEENKRDASYLYSGGRLANIWEQVVKQKLALGQLAQEFVKAGRRRQQRTRAALISTVSLVLIVAIVTSIGFQKQAQISNANAMEAIKQAKIAHSGEMAAQSISLSDEDFLTSLLLAVESYKGTNGVFESLQAQSALIQDAQKNPNLIQYLYGHTASVNKVAFSPDGRILASASADRTVILWNVENQKPIGEPLKEHKDAVSDLAFSPDGKTLASSSLDGTIILWDTLTHQIVGKPFSNDQGEILSVAFSPDGKTIASGGMYGAIVLWNVKTRQPIEQPIQVKDFYGYENFLGLAVNDMVFSPDGTMLASSNWGLVLWDLETRQPIAQLDESPIASIAYSADGTILAGGGAGLAGRIMVWDAKTHEYVDNTPIYHSSDVSSVALSPDGKFLASGGEDNSIILWDRQTYKPIGEPWKGHTGRVTSIAFSSDGKTMASSSEDGTVILWDIEAGQSIAQPLSKEPTYATYLAYNHDGTVLASRSASSDIITLWDMRTRQPIGQLLSGGDPFGLSDIAFSPNGKLLVGGNSNSAVIVWDVETQKPVGRPMTGHTDSITSVAFNPDGRTIASGSIDKTIILWDAQTNKILGNPLKGHTDYVDSVAFSPDGKTLASSSREGTIILWDVKTSQPIEQPLEGHSGAVTSVAFSPNGKILASGSDDRTVILWNVESHQSIDLPLRAHIDRVTTLAFSPDGKILASGSADNTINLWNTETLQLISSISDDANAWHHPISNIAFSPDGKTLASTRWFGDSIILWDLDPSHLADKLCQRAGRNFTRAEWIRYFPNEEYRKTCEQWPLEAESTTTPTTTP